MCEEYDEGYDEQAAAEEAAYQEMCDAGADLEKQQMEIEGESSILKEMNEALDKGTINKDPDSKINPQDLHNCIEREKLINEEKHERRCKQCHCHGKNGHQETQSDT